MRKVFDSTMIATTLLHSTLFRRFIPLTISNMPTTPNCPTGYRWDSTTNKCVPATGTVDPIKPSAKTDKKAKKSK